MFDTFMHHVQIDESRLIAKTCLFDLQLGAYQDQYRMTNVRGESFSPQLPTGLAADIDYVTDRVLHVQVLYRPEKYSDEWLIESFKIVWGAGWALFACALISFTFTPLIGVPVTLVAASLWFGSLYFEKKWVTKRYARDLAHAAHPLVMELRLESEQVE